MSNPGQLPTTADLFGDKPNMPDKSDGLLPTTDELFAPKKTLLNKVDDAVHSAAMGVGRFIMAPADITAAAYADWHRATPANQPPSSPAMDAYFSKTPAGRILRAFGQDAAMPFEGEAPPDPDTDTFLKKAGVYDQLEKGKSALARAFIHSSLRGLAVAADAATRVVSLGALSAPQMVSGLRAGLVETPQAVLAGIHGFGEQAAEEIRGTQPTTLSKIEAWPFGAAGEAAGEVLSGAIPELPMIPHAPLELDADLSERLAAAREAGVIGAPTTEAEVAEGIKGQQQRVAEDHKVTGAPEQPEAQRPVVGEAPTTTEPAPASAVAAAEKAPEAPVSPTETRAREIEPAAFQQYDSLNTRQETYRRWLDDLGAKRAEMPEVKDLQDTIDTILGKVGGVEERLTVTQRERLAEARAQQHDLLHTDTPDMAFVRRNLLTAQHKLWDIGPDIAAAMRQAHEEAAEVTPPQHAATTADTIDTEIEHGLKNLAPEIHNEFPHKSAGEAGAVAGENAVPPGGPNAPGPGTGPRAIPEAVGAVSESGHQTAPEGAKLGAEQAAGEPAAAGGRAEAVAEKPAPGVTGRPMRAVKGTGETVTRGLSEHIEALAIENKLTDTFGDLPEYQRVSMADQAAKALELINKDYEEAKAVAMGTKAPPRGVLPESVLVAVEKRATAEGDVETLRQLATGSRLTTEATTMGQRIRTLGERDRASPVAAIQEVQNARAAARGAKVETEKAAEVGTIKAKIRSEREPKQTLKETLQTFAQSIACDY
jgi:hypothetical protein